MAGLIDEGGYEGLAYTTGTGLQWESRIGSSGLIIAPGEDTTGKITLEDASGFILLEDGVSFIILE